MRLVDSTTASSRGLPGLETDLPIPRAVGGASIPASQSPAPRSEWNTSIAVSGNSASEKAAFTGDASLRRPQEQPAASLSCRSASRQA